MSHAAMPFWKKYLFSTDHKVIGIQYLLTSILMALVGTGLAVMIRAQLAWPTGNLSPETYLSVVTMHGTIMIFFVVSPALIGGFGNWLIPLHIGARDMAYPFLNMASFWTFVPACVLILASFFADGGAAAAGWTAYPPLSALEEAIPGSGMGQTLWLLAMALFIASFTMGGLNYLTTILHCRTEGMSMMRLPLVIWTYLVSTILGLLSFPALTAATILLLLDRHLGTSFYLPEGMNFGSGPTGHAGGTPVLFQHLFWFLGHPEVYVLVLPAVGVGFELLATFGRRPPFGYRTSIWALLVIAVLSVIVWGHHMFTSGMNPYVGEYFSIATVLITIPFAVLAFNMVASLWRSQIRLEVPMLFALGMISVIGFGGLGGLYLGTATSDIYFHDTYFVVGHFHLMIGTVTLFSIFGGFYYWFPKMFGRRTNHFLAVAHFWLTAVPMITIWLLMHFQGMNHLLRRTYEAVYEATGPAQALAKPITVLAYVLAASQGLFLLNCVISFFWGKKAEDNPWEATTLEWTLAHPIGHGNWTEDLPVVHRWPYDFTGDEERAPTPQTVPEAS